MPIPALSPHSQLSFFPFAWRCGATCEPSETEPVITQDCINRMLPIVADSWEKLRGCDVYRLLDSIAYESKESLGAAAKIVAEKRPDLTSDVREALADLEAEQFYA